MALKITNPKIGTQEMQNVKNIWLEAFPPEERPMELEGVLSLDGAHIDAFYDEDKLVGFHVWFEFEWFDYMLFLAVNSAIRGGGYGGKILDAVIETHATRPFYFSVEDPDETPVHNSEQRVKRVRFYETHNCKLSDFTYLENPRMRLMYYHTPERAQEAMMTIYNKFFNK